MHSLREALHSARQPVQARSSVQEEGARDVAFRTELGDCDRFRHSTFLPDGRPRSCHVYAQLLLVPYICSLPVAPPAASASSTPGYAQGPAPPVAPPASPPAALSAASASSTPGYAQGPVPPALPLSRPPPPSPARPPGAAARVATPPTRLARPPALPL
eukprot:tig00000042_g15495.t1